MSTHEHALIYKDNYSILDPIRLKCTICGKNFGLNRKSEISELVRCKECHKETTDPIYSCWDDDHQRPYCKKCMDELSRKSRKISDLRC